ncbi:amino acid permease [Alicyclobacillus acidiphilus]|uniref:amino acid permease n=1 Tax=Alicyclobacillus acidiphilus TaxID=182455 RepID=UPI00082CAEFF|nr:amino acid permease [Alicyclobacillus acidiphilus]
MIHETPSEQRLQRHLRPRHVSMIALGGAIGTGLFVASGSSIHTAGPGGALIAYMIVGVMIYFVMTSLGEMATYMPVSGSFETYASKFVDPAFGFAIGWNYWFSWTACVPTELSAGSIVMKYWFPHSSAILWSAIFLVILCLLNAFSVKGYGEGEYWFAGIKVVTIILFIVVGILMIFGILSGHSTGFRNFTLGGSPIHGGGMAIFSTILVAGYAFSGTEVVGLTAGESENPGKNIPKAIRTVFWRILIFYIVSIFIIGMLIPYTDPNLLNSSIHNIAVSPFTIVFKRAGFALAAAVMNAVILTSVLSAGNSAVYVSSRMLWALAKERKAPAIFAKVSRRGVPINAMVVTILLSLVAFLSSLVGNGVFYTWMLNIVALSAFITWLGITVSHYRFRRAYVAQGRDLNQLPYRAKWFPFAPLIAIVMCIIVIFGQDYNIFLGGAIDWRKISSTYVGIPVFLLLWFGYKWVKQTKVVRLTECNFAPNEAD